MAKKTTKVTKSKRERPAKKEGSATKEGTAEKEQPVEKERRSQDRRETSEPVVKERRKVQRRRQIDPTTCERDYSQDEIEFMDAMDAYKRANGRMFPTCSEILEVVRGLGYHRTPASVEVAISDAGPVNTGDAQVETVGDGQLETAVAVATIDGTTDSFDNAFDGNDE